MRHGQRRFAWALVAIACVAQVAAPVAGASVSLDAPKRQATTVEAGAAHDVVVDVPFHLDRSGSFYAKLLVTPFNPVNDGTPHGDVAPDGSAGVSGWWVEFTLLDASGEPLRADANGSSIDPNLGVYVDSTPTSPVALDPHTPYALRVLVHVPRDAADPGAEYEVPFALALREGTSGSGGGSGATFDGSHGFTQTIRVERPVGGGGGQAPVSDEPSGSDADNATDVTGDEQGAVEPSGGTDDPPAPDGTTTPPEDASQGADADDGPARPDGSDPSSAPPGGLATDARLLLTALGATAVLALVAIVLSLSAMTMLRRSARETRKPGKRRRFP